LLDAVEQERRTDNEVREALLAVLVRFVDEYRFGLRVVTSEEMCELARAWSLLNDGETPAETLLRVSKRRCSNE
jgi:hypothetical protein